MRINQLCSIAHNIADSFGSGASMLFNFDCGFCPYSDAARSPEGLLEVDFLAGKVIFGIPSSELVERLALSPSIVADICSKHGQPASVFSKLQTSYATDVTSRRFKVSVTDFAGRSRIDHYDGSNGKRIPFGKHPSVMNL
jgi:hypothetical protein